MSQVSKRILPKNIQERLLKNLWSSFSSIKNHSEAKVFLEDFLSPTEKTMFAKRIAIAILLKKNYDFRAISSILKVSTTTVNSIYKLLNLKSKSYNLIIEKYNRRQVTKELFQELERYFYRLHPGKHLLEKDVIKYRLGHKDSTF